MFSGSALSASAHSTTCHMCVPCETFSLKKVILRQRHLSLSSCPFYLRLCGLCRHLGVIASRRTTALNRTQGKIILAISLCFNIRKYLLSTSILIMRLLLTASAFALAAIPAARGVMVFRSYYTEETNSST